MSQKTPRNFFKPLAIGAPAPMRDLPVKLERMIHFVPPHIEKIRAKVPDMAPGVDVILGNLEDAIPADAKMPPAPASSKWPGVRLQGKGTGFWSRVNCLNSPWFQDDVLWSSC
jgi:malyl-CoA/(S)-citramalyl-CoA lyase